MIIAPRTLQALGVDRVFTNGLSRWISTGKKKDNEPFNGTIVTAAIAFFLVYITFKISNYSGAMSVYLVAEAKVVWKRVAVIQLDLSTNSSL